MIEQIHQHGPEIVIKLRSQHKPIYEEWRHWAEKWVQWAREATSEDYWFSITAPTEAAASSVQVRSMVVG